MERKRRTVFLPLCLALILCACGRAVPPPAVSAVPETAAPETAVPAPAAPFDVPGEEAERESAAPDGLEGAYYNDYLRMTLLLDGAGGCTLHTETGDRSGSYRSGAEGALRLTLDGEEAAALRDSDGDITIEGFAGRFLRDWDFWGITEEETGVSYPPESDPATAVRVDNGDGTVRFRDFDNGVALTCPAEMRLLADRVVGGMAVSDGEGGYVTARNVTGIYTTHGGTDAEFLEDYVKNFVFTDFALLYGSLAGYESFLPEDPAVEGRLAELSLALKSAGDADEVRARVLLYTSSYADGTVNYICKTVFTASAEENALAALERAVKDVGAVRLVPAG